MVTHDNVYVSSNGLSIYKQAISEQIGMRFQYQQESLMSGIIMEGSTAMEGKLNRPATRTVDNTSTPSVCRCGGLFANPR